MPYQEIAQTILDSSEIRVSNESAFGSSGSLVNAFAFVTPHMVVELSLEDKGEYLDLRVEPVLRNVNKVHVDEWTSIFSGVIVHIEIFQRWFIEEPSRRLSSRFAGFKVIGDKKILEVHVDDDVIGAFIARLA